MNKKKKLIIFDIDGTLTDSVAIYHKVVIDALKLMGIGKIDTDFYHYKYHTDSYTLKFNYENFYKKPISENLLVDFEQILEDELKKYPPVKEIKGAKECVSTLLKTDYAVAFATGSLPKPAILKLEQCEIWHDPSLIATSKISYDRETFVLQAIEDAKAYFKICQFDQIYSIGDGIWDLQTAQKLQLDFIGVGNKQKNELLKSGCKIHMEDLTELTSYLI